MKLHLGCGSKYLPGFIHVDVSTYPHIDYINPIDRLPMIDDGTVDLIYCANAFQYFDREEAIEVLEEWRRILKPDGILRLSVPNFETIVAIYEGDLDERGFLGPLFGQWDTGEQRIYHKTVYDYMSLSRLLIACNFQYIQGWRWQDVLPDDFDDYSKAYMPHMDVTGVHMALNLEAVKGAL